MARYNRVEMPELERTLRATESGGQSLPRRLGDDPWPREAEQRPRLGDADVGQRGEARQDPSGTGIDEDGDEGRARLGDQIDRACRLGHLHEAENALLHARAA